MSGVRDLAGYGRERPSIVWPNGARVAVSLVVNFEEGAERGPEAGDPQTERFSEIDITDVGAKRNLVQEQIFGYGTRVGLWRFLDAFERHRVPATFMMCTQACERAPEAARAAVEAGHEAALHGLRWISHAELYDDRESERAAIADARDRLEAVVGEAPVGFMCRGSQNAWTRSLLPDLGFRYDSNALDDELPYFDPSAGRDLVILPYAFDTNDMKFFHRNGFVRPEDFSGYVVGALRLLVAEAQQGRSSMLSIGLHLRITGRPARFPAVLAILAELERLGPVVWVACRREIAEWFARA